jgi:PadR family transcriptional regulator PadR
LPIGKDAAYESTAVVTATRGELDLLTPAPAARRTLILAIDIGFRCNLFMGKATDLLQETLDLLVLRILELRPLHGVGIADRIDQVTGGVFVIGPGSLFPALHRIADKGWIQGEWSGLDNGRRAKFYALTASGRNRLGVEKHHWQKVHTAVNQVLAEES